MNRQITVLLIFSLVVWCISCKESSQKDYDIIVYSGTSSGVMAAYTASMKGAKVLLIEPGQHLGGLSASGLGETDIGNKYTVSGLSRDFYRRLGKHYGQFEAWRFEPHVAEKIFNQYIKEGNVEVLYNHRLSAVTKEGTSITAITLEDSYKPDSKKTLSAKVFIDAGYEGDLLAKAGVSYHIGREANSKYDESLNGVVDMVKSNQFPDGIDPYLIPGDSLSGLIWGISDKPMKEVGTADAKVQAYNFRLCMTTDTTNQIPITKPASYDPTVYEGLRRIIKQREAAGWTQRIHQLYLRISPMPNQKTDINNKGGFSTDLIGASREYPEASYERRKKIEQEHRKYIEGLVYFLAYDEEIPQHIKDQMRAYGWPKDEFKDNGGFPHQIYVREARRMVAPFVMTEHHVRGKQIIQDTIALGAYNLDSHHSDRHVVNGMIKNEGEFQEPVKPYAISYQSIIPDAKECDNLIVTAAISASHVAYGSIRMEPVFMMLGQAGGLTAVEAINKGAKVNLVEGNDIKQVLKTDPLVNGSFPEIELNNESAKHTGNWQVSKKKYTDHYYLNYLVTNENEGKEAKVEFKTTITEPGEYELFFYITGEGRKDIKERATAVPLTAVSGHKQTDYQIDMSQNLEHWIKLGDLDLDKGEAFFILDASGIQKEVIADAIILKKK